MLSWPHGRPSSGRFVYFWLARRLAGRGAYERAMQARGIPRGAARIFASALPLFAGLDD